LSTRNALVARVASWKQSAMSMISSGSVLEAHLEAAEATVQRLPGPFNAKVGILLVLMAALVGICFGACAGCVGQCVGFGTSESESSEESEPEVTKPNWMINYVFLVLVPCVFVFSSLFMVRDFSTLLQNWSYLALVMVLMLLQCMMAAGPVADGLVDACLKLPKVLVNAFTSLSEDVGDKLEGLIIEIIGESPLDKVVDLITDALTGVISPILWQCADILDVRNFLPAAFFNVQMLVPFLGVGLFLVFLNLWAFLSNILVVTPPELGIVTLTITLLMLFLLAAALFSHRVVQIFVYTMQGIINFSFRTLVVTLLPTERLDPAMKLLGEQAPTATDLKMKIVALMQLNLNLEDAEDDDENLFEDLHDELQERLQNCCKC